MRVAKVLAVLSVCGMSPLLVRCVCVCVCVNGVGQRRRTIEIEMAKLWGGGDERCGMALLLAPRAPLLFFKFFGGFFLNNIDCGCF